MEMNSEVFRIAKEAARSLAAKEISYKEAVDSIASMFPKEYAEKDVNGALLQAERILAEALVLLENTLWPMEQTREIAKEVAQKVKNEEINYRSATLKIVDTLPPTYTRLNFSEALNLAEEILDDELIELEKKIFTEDKRREVVKETAARIYNREITYKRGVHCILRTFPPTSVRVDPEAMDELAEQMLDDALLELEEAVYTTEKTEQAAKEAARQFTNDQLGYMDAVYYILTSLPPTRLRLYPISSEKYAEELLIEALSAMNVPQE